MPNPSASPVALHTASPAAAPAVSSASRRGFVCGATFASLAPLGLLSACAGPGGLFVDGAQDTPRTGAVAERAAQHYRLANRVSWGATDAELERLARMGAVAWVDVQLRAGAGPLPPAAQAQIDGFRISQRPPLEMATEIEATRKAGEALATEEARKAAQDAYQQALNRLAREAASRQLLRALYSPNQLLEQMQWFWFNHFNVHQYKSNLRVLLGDYEEQALRPHALGRFRDLLGAATRHPAMLRYLDNEQNAAARINENHARELLELHTLGVDGGYSQHDVQELARVLTGHGVNFSDKTPKFKPEQGAVYRRAGAYEFNPARHDFGDKQVLGRNVRGQGPAELDEVLDHLAAHPATARFVSGKIARQLLADEPPPALLDSMAATWQRSGGDIAAVLAVLLRAPEFTASGPGKFKDPVHYVVSAVRAAYGDRVVLNTAPMQGWLNRLGQGLYNRQTPDGYPSQAAAWSSSGQLATRVDIARAVGSGSAGLFKPEAPKPGEAAEGMAPVREQQGFPQLARPLYWQVLRPLLAANTRDALDAAASPQDWNTLYLSAPEFMYC